MPTKSTQGMSLLELLLVLGLIALLTLGATPALTHLIASRQANTEAEKILQAFRLARHEAIHSKQQVTLCMINNMQCSKEGALPLTIFIDKNNNRKIDEDEYIVRQFTSSKKYGILKKRASFGRAYFRFKPDGSAMETGRIIYCPDNHELYGKVVTLNLAGRAYLVRDDKALKSALNC